MICTILIFSAFVFYLHFRVRRQVIKDNERFEPKRKEVPAFKVSGFAEQRSNFKREDETMSQYIKRLSNSSDVRTQRVGSGSRDYMALKEKLNPPKSKLQILQETLDSHLAVENYEEAAKIRDKINQLKIKTK